MAPTFVDEVLRINLRYVVEFIERFNVCPFAQKCRTSGALHRRVFETDELEGPLAALAEMETIAGLEIGMLIFPRTQLDMNGFELLTRRLRERYEAPRGIGAPLILATFHPRAGFGQKTPAQMTMFWRRAPDPLIQVVPAQLLAAIKKTAPGGKFLFDGSAAAMAEMERRNRPPFYGQSLGEKIASDNYSLRDTVGLPELEVILNDIIADRDASYARCADAALAHHAD